MQYEICKCCGKPKHSKQENKRFPSHLLLSHTLFCTPEQCAEECAVRVMDEQSGVRKSGARAHAIGESTSNGNVYYKNARSKNTEYQASEGGASRYFARFYYTSKASRSERSAGCEELPEKLSTKQFNEGMEGKVRSDGTTIKEPIKQQNHHPTVKPVSLMSYLVRLVTPPNGIVLDPFAGSGTTGIACIQENKRFILIEREEEYVQIIRARIAHAYKQKEIA